MKFLIISFALVAFATAQQFQQPEQKRYAAILRQSQDSSPDGSYSYNYETEDGIQVAEQGTPVASLTRDGESVVVAQGNFQYTAPDGTPIAVTYVADHNGFQPQGAHLPVDHPVPVLIQRALDYIAAHPQKPEHEDQ